MRSDAVVGFRWPLTRFGSRHSGVAPMVRQTYATLVASSSYTDLQLKRVRRYQDRAKRFRAIAAKTKKLTDRPGLIQLAQLCDILVESIEAQQHDCRSDRKNHRSVDGSSTARTRQQKPCARIDGFKDFLAHLM